MTKPTKIYCEGEWMDFTAGAEAMASVRPLRVLATSNKRQLWRWDALCCSGTELSEADACTAAAASFWRQVDYLDAEMRGNKP